MNSILTLLFLIHCNFLFANKSNEIKNSHIFSWIKSKKTSSPVIQYNLSSSLRENHIKSINSGFATFSLVKLEWVDDNKITLLHQQSCTIKLDTWDEIYDVTKLETPVYTATINHLEQYSHLCLQGEIDNQDLLKSMIGRGGKIKITLQIEQISSAQSTKIKEWLISQQSGLMQGLFSHMLGDLTQLEIVKLSLDIPPKPETFGHQLKIDPVIGKVNL